MVCGPTANVEVESNACPAPLIGTTMSLPPSILNVTVPVGVPAPWVATVAVNVTDCPGNELLSDEVRFVVVAVAATSWIRLGDMLFVVLAVLLTNRAKTVCAPKVSEDVVNVAEPVGPTVTGLPSVPSMLKMTVPVGIVVLGATPETRAVNVTGCPRIELLSDEESIVAVTAALIA